ncbi:MAG: hypothetical protein ACE5E7_10390 [Anaerolineae bacterium]
MKRQQTTIQAGKPAPDATLTAADGAPAPLSDWWSHGRHALIVFLRHLG